MIALVPTKDARSAAIAACLAALLYLPTLGFPLVWDDPMLVELTHARLEAGGLGSLLSSEFILGSQAGHTGYFRPVALLSLAVDGALGGGRPWAYHLTNILLHAAVCALVVLLLRRMLGDGPSALFGGLLFAVHPVHVEAVAFVSGRTDLWAAVFVFLACLFWIYGRSRGTANRSWTVTAALSVCLALGALSKELALMTVPVWICWTALGVAPAPAKPVSWIRGHGPWVAGSVAAVAIVLALRCGVAGLSLAGAPEEASAFQLLVPRLATYFRLLAAPWPSSAFYTASDLSLGAGVVLGALVALAVFVLASARGSRGLGAAGLSWTLLFLVPVLGVVTLNGGAAAERFLYTPSFGVCLAAAAIWRRVHDRRRGAALAVGAVVLVLFGGAAVIRSQVWKDEITLYTDLVRSSPRAFVGHFNLGNELAKVGRFEEAEASLARAVQIDPGRADGWNNLGSVRLRLGEDADAERAYAEAIRLRPDFPVARRNLALVLARLGRHGDAATVYGDLLAQDPGDLQARRGRFDALAAQSRWSEALEMLESSPGTGLEDGPRWLAAGKALADARRWDEAERALTLAIRAAPDDAGAHSYLGFAYLSDARAHEAIPLLEKAVMLDPGNAVARFNLAVARLATDDLSGAIRERDALRAIDPRRAAEVDRLMARAGTRP